MRRDSVLRNRSWFSGWVQPILQGVLGRDLNAARVRLGVSALLIAAYWFGLATAADFPRVLSSSWLSQMPFPLNVLADFVTSFFAPQLLRHVLPILGGLYLAIRLGSHYLADMHELKSLAIARRHLMAALFGIGHDTLVVSQGDIADLDHNSPLLRLGGPGYLNVHLGFAAVLEDISGLPKVYGPQGRRFMKGFERLRDVIDLRDQLRRVPELRAVTSDGVEISARDVQMVFRVFGGQQARSLESPYPYTDEAVRRLIYGQPVSDRGPRRWTEGLDRLVIEQIETFVSSLSFENLLALRPEAAQRRAAPEVFHISRRSLTERFHTSEVERGLQEQGLELIWVGVGTWEVRSGGSELSAGKALLDAWKTRQRLDLLAQPPYQQRQRARGRSEAILSPLQSIIKAWNAADGERPLRVRSALTGLHQTLAEIAPKSKDGDRGAAAGVLVLPAALTYLETIMRTDPPGEARP